MLQADPPAAMSISTVKRIPVGSETSQPRRVIVVLVTFTVMNRPAVSSGDLYTPPPRLVHRSPDGKTAVGVLGSVTVNIVSIALMMSWTSTVVPGRAVKANAVLRNDGIAIRIPPPRRFAIAAPSDNCRSTRAMPNRRHGRPALKPDRRDRTRSTVHPVVESSDDSSIHRRGTVWTEIRRGGSSGFSHGNTVVWRSCGRRLKDLHDDGSRLIDRHGDFGCRRHGGSFDVEALIKPAIDSKVTGSRVSHLDEREPDVRPAYGTVLRSGACESASIDVVGGIQKAVLE